MHPVSALLSFEADEQHWDWRLEGWRAPAALQLFGGLRLGSPPLTASLFPPHTGIARVMENLRQLLLDL